ncbi:hypothetical protein BGZ65_011596 [Modicella reniformis]|uniref:Uncharacterized protein n=1 Tax=Modicella reniformis TaxID=1440133 RepID=A0A9P6M3G9_9FUNG|nr:hypothetical protein BGZ65_011596 [Modicella reniformis]
MEFLIEILQSLQKEPCGCDLTKGCYCGTDGVEDHEGKSPCYVCGEWFPDRKELGSFIDGDQGSGSHSMQGQGRAWHEQGSLRHHVAESRVKKWLDLVWRPPLTPATTPEQRNVHQFGRSKTQEDLQPHLQPYYDHHYQNDQLRQNQQPILHSPIWNQVPLEHQGQYPYAQYPSHHHPHHHQQQQQQWMEPGRPWSFHDIEIEARTKSRSRQNSSSSMSSNSSVSYYGHYGPSSSSSSPGIVAAATAGHQQQQDLLDRSNYSNNNSYHGTDSGSWRIAASPKPIHAMSPHVVMQPSPQPWTVHNVNNYNTHRDHPILTGAHSAIMCQTRARTLSYLESQQDVTSSTSSSLRSFTPPMPRPSSSNSIRRSRPIRASSAQPTFAIPQEILDPSYRSPSFRIKSWSPPSVVAHSPASRNIPSEQQGTSETLDSEVISHPKEKQTRENRTSSVPESRTGRDSLKGRTAEESSLWRDSDQQGDALVAPQTEPQGNTRESESSRQATSASPAPFRFSFTSERFREVVQASQKNTASIISEPMERKNKGEDRNMDKDRTKPVLSATIHQTAAHPELRVNEVLVDEESDIPIQKKDEAKTQPLIGVPLLDPEELMMATDALASRLSKMAMFSEPSHHINNRSIKSGNKDIQKSAPMSPHTPRTLNDAN